MGHLSRQPRRRDVRRIPTEPLSEPFYFCSTRAELVARVLAGLELGAFDRQTVGWLTEQPASMVLAVAAWIERARLAGGRLYPEEIATLDSVFTALSDAGEPALALQVFRLRQRLTHPDQSST